MYFTCNTLPVHRTGVSVRGHMCGHGGHCCDWPGTGGGICPGNGDVLRVLAPAVQEAEISIYHVKHTTAQWDRCEGRS